MQLSIFYVFVGKEIEFPTPEKKKKNTNEANKNK